jgi:hypothetical protein
MVNIRDKGQRGEREVVDFINDIYDEVHELLGIPLPPKPIAQRRQNQSAVGGMDLDNTCAYAIEVKNQENLQVNTWWKQTITSASETGKIPVLLYKQSRKGWKVVIQLNPAVHDVAEFSHYIRKESIRATIELDDFREIFRAHAINFIISTGSYT